MSLASEAKLGPCEILSALGAGREGGRCIAPESRPNRKESTSSGGDTGLDSFTKPGLSDNVGSVEQFLSTPPHALLEKRHFALDDGLPFPTQARL
jgi:hypothetical protein